MKTHEDGSRYWAVEVSAMPKGGMGLEGRPEQGVHA